MKNKTGFLGKFKASNISSNRTSIEALSKLISNLLNEGLNDINEESLRLKADECKRIIDNILSENFETSELIEEFLRFGEVFKSILLSHLNSFNTALAEKIVMNYLSIARYLNDTRVNELAVFLAKQIET